MSLYQTIANNQNPSDEPLYNIGVVSRMTDIPVATLRVWERRYDFPESSRTQGGHRLYSEKEILRLHWVKSRIDEGMQTGRAVSALRHMEDDNRLTNAMLSNAARSSAPPQPHPATTAVAGNSSLHVLQQRFELALREHDTAAANQILGDVMAFHPIETLLEELLQPTLVGLGQAWHDGDINVATEHLATNFIRNMLLSWMTSGPPALDVPSVVLACAPGEWHEITLMVAGVLLRRKRWPVTYLGQSLPLSDLDSFLKETPTDAVLLVAMTEEAAENLLSWPVHLPDVYTSGSPVMCYAGRIFTEIPEWQKRVPGIFLGETMQQGIATLDVILRERYNLGPA